jgi:hypothetical protein
MLENDLRLVFIPMAEVVDAPPGLIYHWKDMWWIHHPEKGLAFLRLNRVKHPLANLNERITMDMINRSYEWAECKFMPDVFLKARSSDWTNDD